LICASACAISVCVISGIVVSVIIHYQIKRRNADELGIPASQAIHRPGFATHQFNFVAAALSGKVRTVRQHDLLSEQS
jgi:hypothetical protein